MRRRVAITGLGAVSPYGLGMKTMMAGLFSGKSSLSPIPEEQKIEHISCHVAGLVPPLEMKIARDIRRSMSPMSIYAWLAAKEALEMAELKERDNAGICVGSTLGSAYEIGAIFRELHKSGNLDQSRSMTFFKIMGHTVASNLAVTLGLGGRTVSPTAACATGLQAIGLAYEMIAFGRSEIMLAGGAEEFSFLASATFDKISVASGERDPQSASRPFDERRSGVVCGEGAAILCLEEMEGALARKAPILAEIRGFGTFAGGNLAMLESGPAEKSMRLAMNDAGLEPEDISYVNAHATGTLMGDRAEGRSIEAIFGDSVPVSSLKSGLGHSLAASGALELAACVEMLKQGKLVGQPGDFRPDRDCGAIRYAKNGETLEGRVILKNSFALGGIYSSLVLSGKTWETR